MLLSHSKRLCISLVFIISASPLKAAPTVTSTPSALPDALQKAVPSCAQSCLRASLDERFAVACSGQEGIQCLCSRYSSMGESLGEVALGCMYLSCSKADIQNSADSAYGVCLGQKDAVMPTKTALTYVVTSAPSTTSTPSTKSAATNAPTITSTLQTQLSSIQSAIIDSISTFPSATSSASTTPAAAAMAAEAPPRMTPAQIAGLSVAAVAAFVMAIGLMALSVCLRRRRERRGVLDLDEKGQRQRSARFSHYVPMEDRPEPPSQFPMIPPTAVHKTRNPNTHPKTARPAQRLGVGTGNSSSDSSLPLSQIGVAISAELDSKPVNKKAPEAVPRQQTPANKPTQLNIPFRPVSAMTQDTVFEEDEAPSRRRSSMLLPTPPVPIPPIRALQPSRTMPTFTTTRPAGPTGRRSELFLDIPVRHERPQPKRIIAAAMPSNGSPQPPQPASRPRLAPPFQMTSTATSYESKATTASSRDASNAGDIIDYYFSSNLSQDDYTPKASPAHITRPKETPKTVQFKTKKSRSRSLSRTTSRTSTNIRDSGSRISSSPPRMTMRVRTKSHTFLPSPNPQSQSCDTRKCLAHPTSSSPAVPEALRPGTTWAHPIPPACCKNGTTLFRHCSWSPDQGWNLPTATLSPRLPALQPQNRLHDHISAATAQSPGPQPQHQKPASRERAECKVGFGARAQLCTRRML
jgi:hypothetical protein